MLVKANGSRLIDIDADIDTDIDTDRYSNQNIIIKGLR